MLGQPRPKTRVLPAVTDEENPREHVAELQFPVYLCWIIAGVGGLTVSDCDAPRVKASPRVSVGADGGFWFAHPRPKARVLPEVTDEE